MLPPLPRSAALRWLTDAGPGVPMTVRSVLIAEMVGSLQAAFAGPLNAIFIDVVALCRHGGAVFAWLLALELALFCARVLVMVQTGRNTARGLATAPDFYFMIAIAWCALQGATGFSAMASSIATLQIFAALSFMALSGPICARNYGAPRYAMLLIGLVILPMIAGAQFASDSWLVITMFQIPLLFLGANTIIKRFHSVALTALLAREQSQHLARHDALTGLLNRTGLAEEFATIDAARDLTGVLYIDLDNFKTVNDKLGHPAGDLLLAAVADRLRACTRNSDIVARFGGDEFVVILRGLPQHEVARAAERIVQQITALPFDLAQSGMARAGASVGFACAPDDGLTLDELTRKADYALYEAKNAGKGISRRYDTPGVNAIAC